MFLGVLLIAFIGVGLLYSVIVPVFEAPDENAHFAYARHLAETGQLPVQDPANPGRWYQQGSQPPLYYAVVALVIRAVDTSDAEALRWYNPQNVMGHPAIAGNKNRFIHTDRERFPYQGAALAVHLARLASLLMGVGTVWLTYLIARQVLADQPALALAAAAFVAFLPQFLFISASVNSDNAVTLLSTATVYWLLRLVSSRRSQVASHRLRPEALWPTWRPVLSRTGQGSQNGQPERAQVTWSVGLGICLGLALLSKLSALLLVPFVVLVLAVAGWHRRSVRWLLATTLVVLGVAALVSGWWFLRNVQLYGDPLATNVMMEIAGRRDFEPEELLAGAWDELRGLRWSFWGLFGWFSLQLPRPVYLALDLLTLLAVLGLGIERRSGGAREQRSGGAEEHGSQGAEEQGSKGAEGQGSRGEFTSAPLHLSSSAQKAPLHLGTSAQMAAVSGQPLSRRSRGPAVLLVLWLLFVFVGLIWWSAFARGAQGRLLFPAIAPIAVLVVAGWRAWLPKRATAVYPVLVGLPMLAFALWCLLGVIRPAYARPPLIDPDQIPLEAARPEATFGGTVRLLGVSVTPTDVAPGETVSLTLYWQALAPVAEDALLNIRLFGHDPSPMHTDRDFAASLRAEAHQAEGSGQALELLVNEDTYPGWGTFPPVLWPVGPVVVDRYYFDLPAEADVPTLVRVDVGFVSRATGERWPASDARGQPTSAPTFVTSFRLRHPGPAGSAQQPIARLSDGILLLGYQMVPTSAHPGESVTMILEWGAEDVPSGDYTVFAHLVDAAGRVVAQADGPPRGGDYPTGVWLPGDRVPDRRVVDVPPDAPPGEYHLAVGMYRLETGERLPAYDADGQRWPDDAIRLPVSLQVER